MVKNPPANAGDAGKRGRFNPWVGKISWRRKWQPTPVFLLGKIPWTEEPGGLQSMGSQRVGHDWAAEHTLTLSPIPWQLLMYFLSMYLSVVDIRYKWNHTVCEILCLVSFTQHVQFSPMLCMYQCLISFYSKILFCCVDISHCNYLFISPLVFASFTHFDYYVST